MSDTQTAMYFLIDCIYSARLDSITRASLEKGFICKRYSLRTALVFGNWMMGGPWGPAIDLLCSVTYALREKLHRAPLTRYKRFDERSATIALLFCCSPLKR